MKAWRCVLCGYVHHGDEPPGECPVCGAPASDFEEVAAAPTPVFAPKPRAWRCRVCGYVHEGDAPPAVCPLCAATADSFEPVAETEPAAAAAAPAGRIVILGGGIAGVAAAEAARKTSPDAEILLISREPHWPYHRLNLTRLLAGEVSDDALRLHAPAWYDERRITVRLGAEVVALAAADRCLDFADGRVEAFDRLVLATGAHAFRPPIPGAERAGVFTLRDADDARAILAAARLGAACVCVGGGLLGLETAGALARRGVRVTLLESHAWLMPRQLNARAGEALGRYAERAGIVLRTRAQTRELAGDGRVRRVLLEDGTALDADFVVLATGVRSNTHLARAAGIPVQQGVLVDDRLRTSHPDIWAAGDAAEHRGVLYGSWPAAQAQGGIAGLNAAGGAAEFGGLPRSHTLKILGLGMTSIGRIEPADGGDRVVEDEEGDRYRRFVFRDGRLAGVVLLGDTRPAAAAHRAIEQRRDFSDALAGTPDAARIADRLS